MVLNSPENLASGVEQESVSVKDLETIKFRDEVELRAFRHAYEISGGHYSDDGYLVISKHGLPHPHFVAADVSYTKAEANNLLLIGEIKELFDKYEEEF